MNIKKTILAVLFFAVISNVLYAQKNDNSKSEYYKKEMQQLHAAIEKDFHDSTSGYYYVELDPQKRETKFGHLREYSWLWALCAMFEATNEVEKVDKTADLVDDIFKNIKHYYDPAPPKPGYGEYIVSLSRGQRYYDDNQWIGIAALEIYERTGEDSYLDLGKSMYDFMMTGYDKTLGGGLYWRENDFESKNTCSNGPGVIVALKLYNATKNKAYLDTALMIYNWTNEKLQTPTGLFFDNIKTKDESIGKAIFSYNTGTMLQSNVYLYEITGDQKYLKRAIKMADSSLSYFYGGDKFRDGYWFNAVLLRGYQHLLKHHKDLKYILGFKKCLDNALKENKNEKGLFASKQGTYNLVEHGGMLEILARFALLEKHYKALGTGILSKEKKPSIQKEAFGETDGRKVFEYTLENSNGMQVNVINYGGSISDIMTPDRDGNMASVVLGFDTLEEYQGGKNALMGATVGRVANRISKGKFTLDGQEYTLSSYIHGGERGFHKRFWNIEEVTGEKEVALRMSYFSKDGEEGYPGNLNVTVTYTLTNRNELKIDYQATTDKATPLVLTNHSYFNLSGGKEAKVINTELSILADQYLEVGAQNVPTGRILDVQGTPLDFTVPQLIGSRIDETENGGGYDLTYVLRNQSGKLALAASAYEPLSGRKMSVYTTEPGVVLYTGNHLNESITGKGGKPFSRYGAFCLETQHYPDSPNQPKFPNCILRPGEIFSSQTIYKFTVKK